MIFDDGELTNRMKDSEKERMTDYNLFSYPGKLRLIPEFSGITQEQLNPLEDENQITLHKDSERLIPTGKGKILNEM